MKNTHVSVVVPVYGSPDSLIELSDRLNRALLGITNDFEVIFINDASPDDSWKIIEDLAGQHEWIKGINLSRNFGQHRAIAAGVDYSQGEWVVVMDCDLQDQPEDIQLLYDKALEGFDVVFGRRNDRQDNWFKRQGSRLFHYFYRYFTDNHLDSSVANFSIISNKVVKVVRLLKEQNQSYPMFLDWLGFRAAYINVRHAKRKHGGSSYTTRKLFDLAVGSIMAHSNKPLKLSIKFGFLLAMAALVYAGWLIARYFMFSISVEGWTSVMVSIYFLGGLLFANLGIVGLYIGSIFDEVKGRPLYVIKDVVNITEEKNQ